MRGPRLRTCIYIYTCWNFGKVGREIYASMVLCAFAFYVFLSFYRRYFMFLFYVDENVVTIFLGAFIFVIMTFLIVGIFL